MDGNRLFREFAAISVFFLAVFLAVSVYSYWPMDPSFNQKVSAGFEIHNVAGVAGAYLGGTVVEIFGVAALIFPAVLFYVALVLFLPSWGIRWWQGIGLAGLLLSLAVWSAYPWPSQNVVLFRVSGGGFLGSVLNSFLYSYFHFWGSLLVLLFFSLFFLQLTGAFSWLDAGRRLMSFWGSLGAGLSVRKKPEKSRKSAEDALLKDKDKNRNKSPGKHKNGEKKGEKQKEKKNSDSPKRATEITFREKQDYPPLDILALPDKPETQTLSQEEQKRIGQIVQDCLQEFGIQGEVQRILPGPVIIMLEFKPVPGVKVSRIANLNDDLARALKAVAVRIIAPLPGRDTVGIEIPNQKRKTVFLREILESSRFVDFDPPLPLVLGQDIQGEPHVEDLTRMPHLLVAGATGAGKSVCLNSLLISLLYNSGPEDLKFLLIDPKRIELAVYNDLPHLVHPVVTDTSLAQVALDWAVHEMEKRYDAMASLGVRNIEAYNKKLSTMDKKADPQVEDLQPMPYLVLVIDEMADLMLTAAKEVEVSVVRLAQLARAAGIHLILATQRPSVDVVTGIIKANFPSRIAFQVSSKHDSRTILDGPGAEYLLGLGDMLFKAGGGQTQRVHGPLVQDEEIDSVVQFWKQKGGGEELVDLAQWKEQGNENSDNEGGNDPVLDDPRYKEAVDFVRDQGKASISLIQRRLRVGFNKAALFIEQMEKDGVIGPQEGSKPRQVLKKSGDR